MLAWLLLDGRAQPGLSINKAGCSRLTRSIFSTSHLELLLLALSNQVFFISLADVDVKFQKLLLIHVVKLAEDRQIDGQNDVVCAEDSLASLAFKVRLAVQGLTLDHVLQIWFAVKKSRILKLDEFLLLLIAFL